MTSDTKEIKVKIITLNIIRKNDKIKDRIKGMIFGVALGDSLGMPHEFRYSPKNYTGILEHVPFHQNRFQGTTSFTIGQMSDDRNDNYVSQIVN